MTKTRSWKEGGKPITVESVRKKLSILDTAKLLACYATIISWNQNPSPAKE